MLPTRAARRSRCPRRTPPTRRRPQQAVLRRPSRDAPSFAAPVLGPISILGPVPLVASGRGRRRIFGGHFLVDHLDERVRGPEAGGGAVASVEVERRLLLLHLIHRHPALHVLADAVPDDR